MMNLIIRKNIWYPPLLATVLYGIYVISTNFNSPENFSWIALSKSIIQFYAYLYFIGFIDRRVDGWAFHKNLKLVITAVFGWIISMIFGLIFYVIVKQTLIVLHNQNDSIGFYHLLITSLSITVGYVLILSMHLVTKSSQQQLEAELKQAAFEKEQLQLRYELLYNKLEPHFLFNNLNTLHSLIVEENRAAEGFVMSLSKVMRYSFQSQDQDAIAVEEELKVFDHYISILKERLGEQLTYHVQGLPASKLIVPMTLLNLLENVIKHNEIGIDRPILITIELGETSLQVANNVNPRSTNDQGNSGLKTLKEIYRIRADKEVRYGLHEGVFKVQIPYLAA